MQIWLNNLFITKFELFVYLKLYLNFFKQIHTYVYIFFYILVFTISHNHCLQNKSASFTNRLGKACRFKIPRWNLNNSRLEVHQSSQPTAEAHDFCLKS